MTCHFFVDFSKKKLSQDFKKNQPYDLAQHRTNKFHSDRSISQKVIDEQILLKNTGGNYNQVHHRNTTTLTKNIEIQNIEILE